MQQKDFRRSYDYYHQITATTCKSTTTLSMAIGDDDGPSLGTRIVAGLLLALFVVGSILPTLMTPMSGGGGGMSRDLSIADSVVTTTGKKPTIESPADRLSRATIQEKLSSIPIFYITNGDALVTTDFYISYEDAKKAMANGDKVKTTTLDQVM
jgi:hypothetical protein